MLKHNKTPFSAPSSFLDQVGSEESPTTSSPAENTSNTDQPPAGVVNITDLINQSFVVRNVHRGDVLSLLIFFFFNIETCN